MWPLGRATGGPRGIWRQRRQSQMPLQEDDVAMGRLDCLPAVPTLSALFALYMLLLRALVFALFSPAIIFSVSLPLSLSLV
jgi:hypothetical protein